MTLRQVYEKFAADHNLQVAVIPGGEQSPDSLGILINGEFGEWTGYAMCFEEENLFAFFVNLGITVPKENREKTAELLNQINFGLKFGGFYMDSEEGQLMTRATQYVFGTEKDCAWQVENCVKVCAVIADAYYKQIMRVVFA